MKKSLFNKYKYNKCPVCEKSLIFNGDYTKCACQDINCKFNEYVDIYYGVIKQ